MMQLVEDAPEGAAQIIVRTELEIAAAGVDGDAAQAGIRQTLNHDVAQTSAAQLAAALDADPINHHVGPLRMVDDVDLREPLLAKSRAAVLAVAHHEHDGPPALVLELSN